MYVVVHNSNDGTLFEELNKSQKAFKFTQYIGRCVPDHLFYLRIQYRIYSIPSPRYCLSEHIICVNRGYIKIAMCVPKEFSSLYGRAPCNPFPFHWKRMEITFFLRRMSLEKLLMNLHCQRQIQVVVIFPLAMNILKQKNHLQANKSVHRQDISNRAKSY